MSLFKRKPWTGKTELLFSDKALTALILPLFLEQLLSVFVGLSDSIMVAQVGEAAVSAVSLVDSIAILLINIFNALAPLPSCVPDFSPAVTCAAAQRGPYHSSNE